MKARKISLDENPVSLMSSSSSVVCAEMYISSIAD